MPWLPCPAASIQSPVAGLQSPQGLNSGSLSMALLPTAPPPTLNVGLNHLHSQVHPRCSPAAMLPHTRSSWLLGSLPAQTPCLAQRTPS